MKKLVPLIIIVLGSFNHSIGQCNYPSTITLSSQMAIDDYAADYSSCPIHEGRLVITSVNAADTLDLSPLNFLTEVTGDLIVSGPKIVSLNGIHNIKTVGEDLQLMLTNVKSFSPISGSNLNLGSLRIRNNLSLLDIDAFHELGSIGSLTIINNPILENLDGFNELMSITGDLGVWNNSLLNDCSSLCTILDLGIPGSLSIWGNPFSCSSVDELLDHCPSDPCNANNYITIHQIPIESQTYQAAGISSTATVLNQSDIEFIVNDFVEILVNFEVELGAVFYAYAVSCP